LYAGSVTPIRHEPPGARERFALGRRDASLVRVGSITKSIGVGVVAAVGVLGLYVSKALPGHHASVPATQTPAASQGSSGPTTPGSSSPASSSALTPPTSPPARTRAPAPVTSGAS